MARSTPSRACSPRSTSSIALTTRTRNAGRLVSPYAEEEADERDLIRQIRRLKLPNSSIINVLSERFCTREVSSIKHWVGLRDGHWLKKGRRVRPKVNIGCHLIEQQDLTRQAGFLEGLTARKIQDLLLSASSKPSTWRNLNDPSVPIRLQALAARSRDTTLVKPSYPSSTRRLQASHLCHNPSCFSPHHIILEPRDTNIARNSCRNRINTYIQSGSKGDYNHACVHGNRKTGAPSCILPTTVIKMVKERTVTGGVAEWQRARAATQAVMSKAEAKVKRVVETSGPLKKAGGAAKLVGRAGAAKRTRSLGFELIITRVARSC